MSQFGYNQLEEQLPETSEAGEEDDSKVEILTSFPLPSTSNDRPELEPAESGSHSNHGNSDSHWQANVKYTALKPSSPPRGLSYSEGDSENSGSVIDVGPLLAPRRKWSKVNTAILILMSIFLALVIFAVFYVFVIFPSHNGKIVYPDGKMHTEDLAKFQKLGDSVTITSCGLVRGSREKGAYVFKGIPYALPPTGSRRWKRPLEMSYHTNSCWSDVLNATRFGSMCVQPRYNDTGAIQGSEDCLFLNVWTPSLVPADNLPVLVWLHSGDFVHGSGHMPGMSPSSEVAMTTNAVYVSMNYRLGAFGFLALDVLRQSFRGPTGNYGIMDQQFALHWVKENIRHFGGNELDVTIFGHGSGATSVQALLGSGHSHQLFHRAWMASPTAILNKTLGEACKDNHKFLTKSHCRSRGCLRGLSAVEVSRSSPWSLLPYWTVDQIFHVPYHSQIRNDLAIYDGEVVHWSPSTVGPFGLDVPVILGTTYFELSNLKTETSVINLTAESYNTLLVHQAAPLGTDAVIQIKNLYSDLPRLQYTSPAQFPPFPSASFAHLIGDIKNVCPLKRLSEILDSLYSSPVYMYAAEIYPSHNILLSSSEVNSFVGWDLMAFFNGFTDLNFAPGEDDINFMVLIREQIMSFIRHGKPSAARWKTVDKTVGIIGRGVTVSPAPSDYLDKCDFWKHYGYFNYTWDVKA